MLEENKLILVLEFEDIARDFGEVDLGAHTQPVELYQTRGATRVNWQLDFFDDIKLIVLLTFETDACINRQIGFHKESQSITLFEFERVTKFIGHLDLGEDTQPIG